MDDDAPKGSERTATAYHEAGHAVMALVLGRPVASVSIVPDQQYLGLCEFGKAVFRPSEDWIEREALIALAGLAAEARHSGDYAWDAAARDLRYVESLTEQRAGNARQGQRLLKRLLSKAEHLLSQEENWRVVESIARELLQRDTISGRTARHLYEEGQRER